MDSELTFKIKQRHKQNTLALDKVLFLVAKLEKMYFLKPSPLIAFSKTFTGK